MMVISGLPSPLFNVCANASPADTAICQVLADSTGLDSLSLHADEPLVFICANIRATMSFFQLIPPSDFFGKFRDRKSLIFADASKPFWQIVAKDLLPYVDAYAAVDCIESPLELGKWVPHVYMPIREQDWAHATQPKLTDLGFYGSAEMFPERRETIDFLLNHGVKIAVGGGGETGYALNFMEALRDTKLTINFSNCNRSEGPPIHHVKGRIWEAAMSRTAIIETANPVTPKLFSNDEIVWFERKEELLPLIENLLTNDVRRQEMTERMFEKAKLHVAPDAFWAKFQ